MREGKFVFLTPKVMVVLEFFMEDPLHEYHKREAILGTVMLYSFKIQD